MRRALLTAGSGIALPAIGGPFMGGFYAGIIDTTKGNIIAADYFQTGSRFVVILAPKAMEINATPYKTANTAAPPAAATRWNGLAATAAMNSTTYPAARYCATQSYPSDGGSPWYLPALDEQELIYRNLKPATANNYTTAASGSTFPGGTVNIGFNPSSDPPGSAYTTTVPGQTAVPAFRTGGAETFSDIAYWTATDASTTNAWIQYMTNNQPGRQFADPKNDSATNVWTRPVRRLVF